MEGEEVISQLKSSEKIICKSYESIKRQIELIKSQEYKSHINKVKSIMGV